MTCILITSIGSLSAISLVQCLAPVRDALRIVGTNSLAEAVGNFLADRTVLVPPTADADGWCNALERIVREEQPDLVLNGRDEELTLIGQLQRDGRLGGTRCLVPPPDLASLFNDKYETFQFASIHGLDFARTAFSREEVEGLLADCGLPIVVKPRLGGFGSRRVFVACEERDVWAAVKTGDFVCQELLESPLINSSLDSWQGRFGVPWAWSFRSLDHEVDLLLDETVIALCCSAGINDGAYNADLQIVEGAALAQAGEAWGRALIALGHAGPINLQGRLLPDGRYVPFELNARFTGTMIGKARLGYNLALAAIHHWCGIPESPVPFAPTNEVAQRVPAFLAFDAASASVLSRKGAWHG